MKNEKNCGVLVLCLRLSLITVCLLGLSICAFWYPFQVDLTAIGVPSGERVVPTAAQYVEYWVQLAFYWLASIPCFVILMFGWIISSDIKKGNAFSAEVADRLNICALILFVDSLVFLAAQLVFTVLNWNPFALFLYVTGGIGLILSFTLYLAARYVREAAKIKEENEGYV